VTFKPPIPQAAREYVLTHADESRTVLAWRVYQLFGYACTREGIKGVFRQAKKTP